MPSSSCRVSKRQRSFPSDQPEQSAKEISDTTRLSEKTIRFYNTIIFEKLGATNRTEAVKTALQRGIITMA